MTRYCLPDFELANPIYSGMRVAFYLAIDGARSTTLATLYMEPTGDRKLKNPQYLDHDGKFVQPVYVESPVIGIVGGITWTGDNVHTHTEFSGGGYDDLVAGSWYTPPSFSPPGAIVGYYVPSVNEGFIWTPTDSMVGIGRPATYGTNYATIVSSDGSIVCGNASEHPSTFNFDGWIWTIGGGYVVLDKPTSGWVSDVFAMTPDGSRIIGYTKVAGSSTLYGCYWESDGSQVLLTNTIQATAISSDGGTIAGKANGTGSRSHPFYWNASEGVVVLDHPYYDLYDRWSDVVVGISDDGNTIVGYSSFSGSLSCNSWYWTAIDGYVTVAANNTHATTASADGKVIGGGGHFIGNKFGWIWEFGVGLTYLGTFGGTRSQVLRVSRDGTCAVGWAYSADEHRKPFRWTRAGGLVNLGTFGGLSGEAVDVASDGTSVIGWAHDASGVQRPFYYILGGSLEDINTLTAGTAIPNSMCERSYFRSTFDFSWPV